jgi:hypothetical protein
MHQTILTRDLRAAQIPPQKALVETIYLGGFIKPKIVSAHCLMNAIAEKAQHTMNLMAAVKPTETGAHIPRGEHSASGVMNPAPR